MIRTVSTILLCGALIACGYHLSGAQDSEKRIFDAILKQISVEGLGRYDPLYQHLISTLRSYGFQITGHDSALTRLTIEDKQIQKHAAVIGDEAKAREYLLTMIIRFNVRKAAKPDDILLYDQTVRAETLYRHNPIELLTTENLRRDAEVRLEEEIVRNIIARLAAIRSP